jgi:hypothetical protein
MKLSEQFLSNLHFDRKLLPFFFVLLLIGCAENRDYPIRRTTETHDLPVIEIFTMYGETVSSTETWNILSAFFLTDTANPQYNIARTDVQFDRIRGRGNSTWDYPKKPYRLKFKRNVPFFGLPAAENWVLLAEYQDPTFLMNAVGFELSRNIFELPYTPSYQHVHLYLNATYQGLYALTEHRQADPLGVGTSGRVEIDFNSGWFVEIDARWDESPKFRTENYDLPIMIKDPESVSTHNYIKNDLNKLLNLMASSDFPENGYRELIDLHSVVDFLMINEIVNNHELAHPKSIFCYKKDTRSKISFGPLWDFDWGFSMDYPSIHTYFVNPNGKTRVHTFFKRFFEDPIFVQMYKARWNEKYSQLQSIPNFIHEMGQKLEISVAKDTKRWNVSGGYQADYPTDYNVEINKMTTWFDQRISWLNTQINVQ